MQFVLDTDELPGMKTPDEYDTVEIHLQVDNWKGDVMSPVEGQPTKYEIYRMVPPHEQDYYFSINQDSGVA